MITQETKFQEFLEQKGLKFTPERQAILREISSLHKHFDVDGLYEILGKNGKNISRATIYRTLPFLIECGLIKEALRGQPKITYEYIFGRSHHDHLVCVKCGKIIEFRNDKIEKLQEMVCRKYNFHPLEHRLGIKGYCKECWSKLEGGGCDGG